MKAHQPPTPYRISKMCNGQYVVQDPHPDALDFATFNDYDEAVAYLKKKQLYYIKQK